MRENLTELVFILDRSGSMAGLESDTIGGYNAMIEKQQKEAGEVFVSTVLFDDEAEVIHDRAPIGNVHKYAREEDRPAKTLFVITTDGLENASRKYSFTDVKKLIQSQQEKYHWEFLFLGANIDAIKVAGSMGIKQDRAANYNCDGVGTALNYRVIDEAVTRIRECKVSDMETIFVGGAWKEDIDRDFEKRGEKHEI